MKNRKMYFLLASALVLWVGIGHGADIAAIIKKMSDAVVATVAAVKTSNADRHPITYGSVVTFRHALTGRYLSATNDLFFHPGSSGQPAVYCGDDGKSAAAQWIIKGMHTGGRWTFDIHPGGNAALHSMIGWPLRRGSYLRLENVATGRNLHGHHCPAINAPHHGQREVTNYGGGGVGNSGDNFSIEHNDEASGGGHLASGFKIKLRHLDTGLVLHSHGPNWWWQPGKQEVTLFGGRDDNDWWVVETVVQPDKNPAIEAEFKQQRGVKVAYWTPVFWDGERSGLAPKMAHVRLWAHGGSRHDHGNNPPPHDHMEILGGPWHDARTRQGPSIFLLQNADNKFKTGPVQFGDRVKIIATWGGAGEADKRGLLLPFRYCWVNEWSRYGNPHREIVISRPEHGSTQNNQAVFVLEPIVAGQTGEISVNDIVRVKSVSTDAYAWVHEHSRYGDNWHELLLDKGGEDGWGRAHYGWYRRAIMEKFRFSLATDDTISDGEGRNALAAINKEIGIILGAEAAKQKAVADAAKIVQLEQEKAAAAAKAVADKAEQERLKVDAANQLAALKKAADIQLAEAAKKGADALAAAQKAADEAMAKMKDQLNKDRIQAREMMQKAKDEADAARKEAEELANQKVNEAVAKADQKISEAAAKAKIEADRVLAIADEMKRQLDLPAGFIKIPGGEVRSFAFGLQDREIEKAIDNKGTKEKVVSFDDFGVIILKDGSVAQFMLDSDPSNPWLRVPLVDDKGVAVKVSGAGVGIDGTTVVISQDGKSLYGLSWPGDTPAAMPQASKGFAAADKKSAHRNAKGKRRGARKKRKQAVHGGKHAKAGNHKKNEHAAAPAAKGKKPAEAKKSKPQQKKQDVKKTAGDKTAKPVGKAADSAKKGSDPAKESGKPAAAATA